MRIKKIDVFEVDLPLINPFITSFGKVESRNVLLLKLETSTGLIGYGEAPTLAEPIYTHETQKTAVHILKDFIIPRLLKEDINAEDFSQKFDYIRGHNIAKASVETALWDLRAKQEKKPLNKLINGVRGKVSVGVSIGIQKSYEELQKNIQNFLKIGYNRIKIKIKPGYDYEILKKIRKDFPDINLMVDANSGYSLKYLNLFKKFDEFNLTMIEQPLEHDDIFDHSKLQKEIKTPICLDESIFTLKDMSQALEMNSCKIINVKPTRVGGVQVTREMNNLAVNTNTPLWVGGMLESDIGQSLKIELASLSSFTLSHDIGVEGRYFEETICDKPVVMSSKGKVKVSNRPGIGRVIDERVLKKYLVKKYEFK